MKKFLSLLCAAAMLLSLAACAANTAPEVVVVDNSTAETTAPRADALIEVLKNEVDRMSQTGAMDLNFYGNDVRSADFSVMPESHDLRELGFVNPIRSQGNWGTCWGFAVSAASEISALSRLGITAADFAEKSGL